MEITLDLAQLWPLIVFAVSFVTKGNTRVFIQTAALFALAITVDGLPTVARTILIVLGFAILIGGFERNGKN